MKRLLFIRIVLTIIAVAGLIGWGFVVVLIWMLGNSLAGMGDGAGGPAPELGGEIVIGIILFVFWLFLVSPYVCMTAGAWDWIKPHWRERNYFYSIVMLSILTAVLALLRFRGDGVFTLVNLLAVILWRLLYRSPAEGVNETQNSGETGK